MASEANPSSVHEPLSLVNTPTTTLALPETLTLSFAPSPIGQLLQTDVTLCLGSATFVLAFMAADLPSSLRRRRIASADITPFVDGLRFVRIKE